MIEISNLNKSFSDTKLLSDISLIVPDHSITVVLGRNGCGKSVLLKCVAGLVPQDSGTIRIDNSPDRKDVSIGYVFQKGGLFDSMSVFENLAFAMRRRGINENQIEKIVQETLESVSLSGSDTRYPQELSGGMQKRVSLARALCLNPSYMLYDDPTAGLDPVLTDSIGDLILDIRDKKKVTSLLVTHDLALVEKVADFIYLLYDGKVVYSGDREIFFSKSNAYARQFIEGALEGPIDFV